MHLLERVQRQLGLGAIVSASLGVGTEASAAIVYSGVVNLPIPVNIDGVYLNVVTGATGSAGSAVAGWDINPYSATGLTWFAPSSPTASHGLVRGLGTSATQIDNLLGTNYLIAATGSPAPAYGTGANQTTGATAFIFNSEDNIVGLRFFNESTGATNYGWLRIGLGPSFNDPTRRIIEYAYDDSGAGIMAGELPPDTDGDGVPDSVDNCPYDANPDQADFDADGVGDACDCPGDIDRNESVDATDLSYILVAWGTDGGKTPASDLNRDGIVNTYDLTILLGSWGACPP
jgi:hypothetical protein